MPSISTSLPGVDEPLVSARISVDYRSRRDVLRDAAFEIGRGEILGLAGESGAGKSTIALAMLNLLSLKGGAVRGEIVFEGRNLIGLPEREMRAIRGRHIALVPQSPIAALNPALRLETQFREAWTAHRNTPLHPSRLLDILASAGLPATNRFLRLYPRELSVGLAQRVLIAMAILHQPQLIVADEPTSALDLITRSEILKLFGTLNRELGTSILYISHDLLSVADLCHRVAILNEGEILENGAAEQIFTAPRHPYTKRLVEAVWGSRSRFAGCP